MYQPYPGGVQLPETPRPPAPVSVRNAVKFMYAGLVYAIVFVATLSATKSAIEQRSPQLTTGQVNGMQQALVASAIVGGLVGAGLWVFVARAYNSGKGWARITGTVLFGIATVQGLSSLVAPEAALVKGFWLVGLGAVVLLWQRASSAFFTGARS